jgi:very-short-patch-repair endonuclease
MAHVAPKTLSRARTLRRWLTDAETILWSRLRRNAHGMRFRRRHPIGPFIADFACIRALPVVEVDGGTHGSDAERAYDARREAFMRARGWRVVRVLNVDVYDGLDGVMEMICEAATSRIRQSNETTRA